MTRPLAYSPAFPPADDADDQEQDQYWAAYDRDEDGRKPW